jgi:hypothetical protein
VMVQSAQLVRPSTLTFTRPPICGSRLSITVPRYTPYQAISPPCCEHHKADVTLAPCQRRLKCTRIIRSENSARCCSPSSRSAPHLPDGVILSGAAFQAERRISRSGNLCGEIPPARKNAGRRDDAAENGNSHTSALIFKIRPAVSQKRTLPLSNQ